MAELEKKEQERATENAKLKETLERYVNRVSLLEVENQDLQSAKASAEAKLDKNIDDVHVCLDITIEHWKHNPVHESLVSCPRVLQFKWHEFVTITGSFGHESRVTLVLWVHANLVVPRKSIMEA